MNRVLFVCLGNICRSPLAEAIFNIKIHEKGFESHFKVDSAGTHDYHSGKKPDSRALKILEEKEILCEHRARILSKSDFENFDYIFAMDEENYEFINSLKPKGSHAEVFMMRKFDRYAQGGINVPDPYYGSIKDFLTVYNILEACIERMLDNYVPGNALLNQKEYYLFR